MPSLVGVSRWPDDLVSDHIGDDRSGGGVMDEGGPGRHSFRVVSGSMDWSSWNGNFLWDEEVVD